MAAVISLASCSDDALNNGTEISQDTNKVINIGGMVTEEPEVTLLTRAENDDDERVKAETVPWLKGALLNGLDITYSNLTEYGHNITNERVAILRWTGSIDQTSNRGIYTFRYKKPDGSTPDADAEWYDNGEHYFEGEYVPAEIREKGTAKVSAENLVSDQHDASDYTYDAQGNPVVGTTIGNYTLLSHYIGMPPNWTASATIDQILLPFKHRLGRVIAYVLIDDELKATLEGYKKGADMITDVDTEDPTNTSFSFGNVKVLEKVQESETTISGARTANLTPKWTTAAIPRPPRAARPRAPP